MAQIHDVIRGGGVPGTGAFVMETVKALLKADPANVSSKTPRGWTPLHFAARLLLENGAKANALDNDGVTPLHVAAGMGYRDLAELLLSNGAAVNAEDNKHETPLRSALVQGYDNVVNLLRKHNGHE
jgi:ankyrin repeat protein